MRAQFIWTPQDAAALDPALQVRVRGQDDKIAPHYFRARFEVRSVPKAATLYIAGPRAATVFLNGKQAMRFEDDGAPSKGFNVRTADVAGALRTGENVIAVEAVRGHSSLHTGADATINQVTYGEVLALELVPAGIAVDARPLVASDGSWRSVLAAGEGWQNAAFDDAAWPAVQTLGVLGSKSDFLQWNADAGLYAWPGYAGLGPAMRTFRVRATGVLDVFGSDRLTQVTALYRPGSGRFSVAAARQPAALTLDFGREISGRLHLVSDSATAITVATSYGESAEEANGHPYLGVRQVTVPPQGEAYGPKSAFRYVRLTFPAQGSASVWRAIDAQGAMYPVKYLGTFASSDRLLNRIWETGAYTAHLCMQEGIWDAPKRDRGRWMGDLDVTGRTIESVFADRELMEQTMSQVIGEPPVRRDVNTIAGYSALWITGEAEFYRHSGDLGYLRSVQERLLELLHLMDGELDGSGLFTNPEKHKVFVDWSEGFSSDTPEARAATHFEFLLAYREAAYLLGELGEESAAASCRAKAETLQHAGEASLLNPATQTFGDRWQTNAMAVVAGAAGPTERAAIWSKVLSHVEQDDPPAGITPYYGYYVLAAMAELDHRREALEWMRHYWGGMLAEGATSFWEAYDPRWPKQNFHAFLRADDKQGYYVSLAHGWSSGPTAWLMEQVLGIEPTAAGFREVTIRPDLAGLSWARGAEPTPRGLIRVDVTPERVRVVLPPGTTAKVLLPFAAPSRVLEDGRPLGTEATSLEGRTVVMLHAAGEYVFTQRIQRPQ